MVPISIRDAAPADAVSTACRAIGPEQGQAPGSRRTGRGKTLGHALVGNARGGPCTAQGLGPEEGRP